MSAVELSVMHAREVSFIEPRSIAGLGMPGEYEAAWSTRTLEQVPVLPAIEAREAADAVEVVAASLVTLPSLLYGGDVEEYCHNLGMSAERSSLLAHFAADEVTRYGRADLYLTSTGWQLLEFNFASDLGGVERGLHARLLADSLKSASDPHLVAQDTLTQLEKSIILKSHNIDRPDPLICIITAHAATGTMLEILESLASCLRFDGYQCEIAALGEIRFERGLPILGRRRIDVVLRYFHIDHLKDDRVRVQVEPLVSAARNGDCVLYTSPNSSLFSSKAALALLRSPACLERMPQSQRYRIEQLLPKCFIVAPEDMSFLRNDQEHWVLKPTTDAAGLDVVCGWEVPARRWASSLNVALTKGWLAQRRAEALEYNLQRCDPGLRIVWGCFVVDGKFAGWDARALGKDYGSVINFSTNLRTRVSPVLEHAE